MKKIYKLVFDTNSLISSLLIPLSVSQRALSKAESIGIIVFSEETFDELSKVLIRPKFNKYISFIERMEFLERLELAGEVLNTDSDFNLCRDVKDNKFLNLAYDASAFCIVTGDKDLLILNPFHNIPIITPADFLNLEL